LVYSISVSFSIHRPITLLESLSAIREWHNETHLLHSLGCSRLVCIHSAAEVLTPPGAARAPPCSPRHSSSSPRPLPSSSRLPSLSVPPPSSSSRVSVRVCRLCGRRRRDTSLLCLRRLVRHSLLLLSLPPPFACAANSVVLVVPLEQWSSGAVLERLVAVVAVARCYSCLPATPYWGAALCLSGACSVLGAVFLCFSLVCLDARQVVVQVGGSS
jgi:hypothetical protein